MAPTISNPHERRKRRAKILLARRQESTSRVSKTIATPMILQPINLLHDPKASRKLKNRESAFASRRKKMDTIEQLRKENERLRQRLSKYEDCSHSDEENDEQSTMSLSKNHSLTRHYTHCIMPQPATLYF